MRDVRLRCVYYHSAWSYFDTSVLPLAKLESCQGQTFNTYKVLKVKQWIEKMLCHVADMHYLKWLDNPSALWVNKVNEVGGTIAVEHILVNPISLLMNVVLFWVLLNLLISLLSLVSYSHHSLYLPNSHALHSDIAPGTGWDVARKTQHSHPKTIVAECRFWVLNSADHQEVKSYLRMNKVSCKFIIVLISLALGKHIVVL